MLIARPGNTKPRSPWSEQGKQVQTCFHETYIGVLVPSVEGWGGARGEGTEQMGCPVRHLCTRTLWVPESINHHSGILSVGSWKRRSVLQHWVGGVGVGGILPIHSQLGQKGCVPISLKSLHTCWKGTRCAFLFLRHERECGCQRVLPRG